MDSKTVIKFKEFNMLFQGTTWEHIKTKHIYIVLGVGCNTTNGNEGCAFILYKLRGVNHPPFVREMPEFLEKFTKENHENNITEL